MRPRHAPTPATTPLVSWPVRGRRVLPMLLLARLWRRRSPARRGLRRRSTGRARTNGLLPDRSSGQVFPADQSIARQTAMVLRVHNIGHQTVPNVAVTIDSFAYTSDCPRTVSQQASDLGCRRGPRGDPQASRRERGDEPAPAVWPDGLCQHLGTRRAQHPGRTRSIRLARRSREGRPRRRPLHGRGLSLRQVPRAVCRAAPRRLEKLVRGHRPCATAHPHRPRNRPGGFSRTLPTHAIACPWHPPRNSPVPGAFSTRQLPSPRSGLARCATPPPRFATRRCPSAVFALRLAAAFAALTNQFVLCDPPAASVSRGGIDPASAGPRQQNVTAAQWSANGSALGSPNLTLPATRCSRGTSCRPAVQRQRLPKHVYKALQRTLPHAARRSTPRSRTRSPQAMKDWRGGEGRDPLHPLVPAAHRLHRGEARLVLRSRRRRRRDRGVLRRDPTPPRSPPAASARRSRPAATPPGTHLARLILENPTGPCLVVRPSPPGPARRSTTGCPCCARWTPTVGRPGAALQLLGVDDADGVFTTTGCEQEYFLIDEQYFFERPTW